MINVTPSAIITNDYYSHYLIITFGNKASIRIPFKELINTFSGII